MIHHKYLSLLCGAFFYNVPTTEQVTPQNTAAQFIQKSHIAALDLTYDITDHRSPIAGRSAGSTPTASAR